MCLGALLGEHTQHLAAKALSLHLEWAPTCTVSATNDLGPTPSVGSSTWRSQACLGDSNTGGTLSALPQTGGTEGRPTSGRLGT